MFFPLPKVPSLAGYHVHGMPVPEAEGSSHSLSASSEGCGFMCRPLVGIHAHWWVMYSLKNCIKVVLSETGCYFYWDAQDEFSEAGRRVRNLILLDFLWCLDVFLEYVVWIIYQSVYIHVCVLDIFVAEMGNLVAICKYNLCLIIVRRLIQEEAVYMQAGKSTMEWESNSSATS